MKTYKYRGHEIKPKQDFGSHGYLINGKTVKKGWVVVKDFCNIMPGATWFVSIIAARKAIDLLLRVKGNARKFWEAMQPFSYTHVGQRANFENGSVRRGRFMAVIRNFKVVQLRKNCWDNL